ncbi:hypothetical protein FRC12_011720 [Ceratobasidium sp. 428]|nr:hypothetical protein FRC12_011720 [Ceratobasidium sp. 428]
MIIDKVPIAVAPQPTVIEGQSHIIPSPFAEPLPQTFGTEVPEQSSRMSDDGRPDYAPPPYESIAATSPPRASTRSLLKKPRSASTSTGLEEFDSITQQKARICPLNPEEHTSPCFLRLVPSVSESTTSYQRLPRPFVIDSKSGASTLEDSFATVGTPALYRHDVLESDWEELLGDVRTCARLSSGQRAISGVLPVTRHLGPPGYFASYLAEQGMKRQKTGDVVALLDL